MEHIKNIILDLGGVLFDLDYGLTQKELSKFGLENIFSQLKQDPIFDEIEEGKVSEDEFLHFIVKNAEQSITPNDVKNAWNAMLLGFPEHRLQLLKNLRNHYNLYLFSNTNAIHIAEVYNMLERDLGIPHLDDYFDKVYLSNDLGIRKPKPEGFLHIVNEHGLNKHETLFIDDTIHHVNGAKDAGIHAELLDLSQDSIETLLKKLSIKH